MTERGGVIVIGHMMIDEIESAIVNATVTVIETVTVMRSVTVNAAVTTMMRCDYQGASWFEPLLLCQSLAYQIFSLPGG